MVTEEQFQEILILLVPQVVQLICERQHIDEIKATREFCESQVYELLRDEETKVWHFSPLTLFNMFDEEKKTGSFVIPEET